MQKGWTLLIKLTGLLLTALFLFACGAEGARLQEVQPMAETAEEWSETDLSLQYYSSGSRKGYLVYQSRKRVTAQLESEENKLTIHLSESEQLSSDDTDLYYYTYYLTLGSEHDTLDITINGESVPIELIRSL